MEAQAPAPASKEPCPPDELRGGHGAQRRSGEVETIDAFSRSMAKREAEKAAGAETAPAGAKPLPHEQVPQPRDVYNEQLERL